jgi:hypothetical protein
MRKKYPKITKESLLEYFESRGHLEGRYTLFDDSIARNILNDFEKVQGGVENLIICFSDGKHRPSAVGIVMNEIYDWGFDGLKQEFPSYRRFVYEMMIKASKSKKK